MICMKSARGVIFVVDVDDMPDIRSRLESLNQTTDFPQNVAHTQIKYSPNKEPNFISYKSSSRE